MLRRKNLKLLLSLFLGLLISGNFAFGAKVKREGVSAPKVLFANSITYANGDGTTGFVTRVFNVKNFWIAQHFSVAKNSYHTTVWIKTELTHTSERKSDRIDSSDGRSSINRLHIIPEIFAMTFWGNKDAAVPLLSLLRSKEALKFNVLSAGNDSFAYTHEFTADRYIEDEGIRSVRSLTPADITFGPDGKNHVYFGIMEPLFGFQMDPIQQLLIACKKI